MIFDGLKCGNFSVWVSDGREKYGPKGTNKINALSGNTALMFNEQDYRIYTIYGENYVKWWTAGSLEISGEFFLEPGTWFRLIVREILLEIESITGSKIEGTALCSPGKYGRRIYETPTKIKIMWFSHHEMTESQKLALIPIYGYCEIEQINKTIQNVSEISEEIKRSDVLAVVAPLTLRQQFLATGKPVIYSKKAGRSDLFAHAGWFQLEKIEIIEKCL
jgi:hypothetical protein